MDNSLRILHLDDDPDFPALVSAMLEKDGLCSQVSSATDFSKFLQALEQDSFDLILADYALPAGNGIQALQAARRRYPDIPFLLISGAIREEAAIESLRSGATDYVMKSGLERLVPAVRRAVSEAQERAHRRHAETELIRREKYFRTLTENSLDVLTILDRDACFLYNSPSLKAVLGYDPKELAGRNAFEFVHPEDQARAREAVAQALQFPGRRVTHEFRFLHEDGSWHWLETVGQNRLDDPEIAGLVLNSRDISDRKRSEAEVRENEKQYRLIFESNPIPMWISDLESLAILEVNAAAVQHYGYSREQFLELTTKDLCTGQEAGRMVQFLSKTVQKTGGGVGHAGLWRHLKNGGSPVEVEITWSVIAFKGGQALLTMAQDVTERRRIEQREASLSKLSRGLSAANSPEMAAQVIREVTEDLFGWDCFALGLYAPETDTVRPVLKIETVDGKHEEILLERIRDKPDEVIRRVVRTRGELIAEPESGGSDETELFRCRHRGTATRLFAPLRNGEKVIGILSVQSYLTNAYDQQDLHLLQILADQCAGALERLHAEQAMRESEGRFRMLFEGSPDAIVVADLNANILDANPAACRLWNTDHESMVGRAVANLIPSNWRAEIVSVLARLVAGATSQAECVCLSDDGREVPVEVSGNCIEYGDKQAVLLHLRDISERKRSAAELKKSEASLIAAQRIAHLGSWELEFVDPDRLERNELRWSDETYRIFGLEPGQVTITNELFYRSVHPDDRSRIRTAVKLAFDNREPFEIEHRIVRPDGQERVVRARAEVALGSSGNPIQLRGIVMDITERKRLEEQLRQAQKMEAIGQLAGGVAHDFNNILTVIHGHASLLLLDKDLPEPAGKSVRQIAQAVERASSLTRQLLTFSRRQVMQPRRLDLNELVNNLTMMLGRILGEDITLQLNYWPHPAFIQADAGMIEQVLLNLAVNARDAMPGGGQLGIRIGVITVLAAHLVRHPEARPGQFVCLTVTDTGCGIPPENLRRIFEPFFTTKEVGKGTGLGLATVYGVVKQHQGWIEVESERGNGATFHVYLPATAGVASATEERSRAQAARGGTETILVVEDETPVRELVCSILGRLGYTVLQAESGARAIELWEKTREKVDLLLTDLVMPDRINGRELAERLRAQHPELRVIFTSGYSADVVGKDFVLQRGLHYLQKPYDPHRLALSVRDCLDAQIHQQGGETKF